MNLDFTDIKVLLIGDFMIDDYIFGISNRVSPEAPVPVITPHQNYCVPGGAGNVAMNLSSLGAKVTCVGIIGNDKWGEKLVSILNDKNIDTTHLQKINNHITTLKQRIYLDNEQFVRIDKEKTMKLTNYPEIKKEDYDLVILSDYNKGVLNDLWFDISAFDNVFVDPKKKSFKNYYGAKVITPNLKELQIACGKNLEKKEDIVIECNNLINRYNFDYIVAKQGSKGITVVGKNNFSKHILAHNVSQPDVTGAGDTVIASLSLFYTKTGDLEYSAKFANAAAAVAVGKIGTSYVQLSELEDLNIIN